LPRWRRTAPRVQSQSNVERIMDGDIWGRDFQTTIDAYYAGDLAQGLAACERLLSLDGLPPQIETHTRRNLTFYAPHLSDLAPSLHTVPVEIPIPPGWSQFNPSIAAAGDGFRLILRSGNTSIEPPLRYTVHAPDGIGRTTNYLLDLSPDLAIRDFQKIDDDAFRPEPPLFPVAGFEDCRLVRHAECWWVSATVRDRDPNGMCRIALLRLDGATVVEEHLLSDSHGPHEKNWMPVVGDAGLRFVYSCFPTVVLRFDDVAGTVVPETSQSAPFAARRFRGGSQVIPVDGGWLGIVHEVAHFDDGGRVYTQRWVWFDAEWRLARYSASFVLEERGVEFVAGLAQRGDRLVISYGVWDREAWLGTLSLEEALSLLAPPPDTAQVARPADHSLPHVGVSEPLPRSAMTFPRDAEPTTPKATTAEQQSGITPFFATGLTLVSVTLAGSHREIIADALRSVVDWVDWCLVIDTGMSDDTLEVARAVAGDRLVVRQFPWQDDVAVRNFALAVAAEIGGDWALMLDVDERIDLRGVDVRAALAAASADALFVNHVTGSHGKERFFRLPARGRFIGPGHGAFVAESGTREQLAGVVFDTIRESHVDSRRAFEWDVAILSAYTAEHPDDPRWFYALGDALAGLDRDDEAIAAFRVCTGLNGWDEEGAWAMYRAAECFCKLGRLEEAVEACADGMKRHAGLAELPWLAAYASWRARQPAQAAYWARLSIAMGHFAGAGASVPRLGFSHPPALWEGPYDVLRYALKATGDDVGAIEAERLYAQAKAARQNAHGASTAMVRTPGLFGSAQNEPSTPSRCSGTCAGFHFFCRNREELERICADIFDRHEYAFATGLDSPFIIDAGAHIGVATHYFKRHYPHARVLAVEANPFTYTLLEQNIAHNGLTGVRTVQAALAPEAGEVPFYTSVTDVRPGAWGDSVIQQPWHESSATTVVQVPAITLSSLLTEPVDLLKLDIEGLETAVLAEAAHCLSLVRCVVLEFHGTRGNADNTLARLTGILHDAGLATEVQQFGKVMSLSDLQEYDPSWFIVRANRPNM
jgi:FkbM family methyltransferase